MVSSLRGRACVDTHGGKGTSPACSLLCTFRSGTLPMESHLLITLVTVVHNPYDVLKGGLQIGDVLAHVTVCPRGISGSWSSPTLCTYQITTSNDVQ